MKLTKNGVTYDITDEIQISAFLNSGYRPVDEPEQHPAYEQPTPQEQPEEPAAESTTRRRSNLKG